jgi:hypothetical protein
MGWGFYHGGTEEMWGAEIGDAPRNIGEVALLMRRIGASV